MQTHAWHSLLMLTGLTQGFARQREVHEKTNPDRRLHGAGPIPGRPATKCRSRDVVGSARRPERNSAHPPALKEARNEPKPQRVQQDEVDAAARSPSHRHWSMVDETLAVFGVVRDPTAHALARPPCGELGQPSHCWRGCARGYRGLKLTQTGFIESLARPPPLSTTVCQV